MPTPAWSAAGKPRTVASHIWREARGRLDHVITVMLVHVPAPTMACKERKEQGGAMKLPITGHDALSRDDMLVYNWRVSQLTRLGIPGPLAEICAGCIDWHQVAG
jgi:hypothetical protein